MWCVICSSNLTIPFHPIDYNIHSQFINCTHKNDAQQKSPLVDLHFRIPWHGNRVELIQDSCGAGKFRGGLGVNFEITMKEDAEITTACERSKLAPWGLNGGQEGLANNCFILIEDDIMIAPKTTRTPVRKGGKVLIQAGGGGGYGDPDDRDHDKVLDDYKQEYISLDLYK